MRTARVSVTPVIDGGKLVGMLTRDIASEGSSEGKSVKEVMMKPKAFVEENASLDDVADMMIKTGMSRLPVVNNKRAMHFVGMITATEIVREMKK